MRILLGFRVSSSFFFLGGPYFIPTPNLLFMEFVAPSLDSSSSSSDGELLDEIDVEQQVVVQAIIMCQHLGFFHTNRVGGGW
jgi:hypothetical protein